MTVVNANSDLLSHTSRQNNLAIIARTSATAHENRYDNVFLVKLAYWLNY